MQEHSSAMAFVGSDGAIGEVPFVAAADAACRRAQLNRVVPVGCVPCDHGLMRAEVDGWLVAVFNAQSRAGRCFSPSWSARLSALL